MAGLMDDLIDVLSKECDEYRKLIVLSKEKTPVIVSGDIQKLEEITEKEQDITSGIINLDNKRESISDDIAIVLNRDKSELKLDNLILLMENQPREREALVQVQRDLRSVLKEMTKVNEQNALLLRRSIEMVEFDMELFKSMRQAPETANYNNHAENTGVLLHETSFDSRQ